MGLFNRKKELKDPVAVKCWCDNGIWTSTNLEKVRNPEPRPQFYSWMNNPNSEEYGNYGDGPRKKCLEYEPYKIVAGESSSGPCSFCHARGFRVIERSEAFKEKREFFELSEVSDQKVKSTELTEQLRDLQPTAKPWRATFYKKLGKYQDDSYSLIDKMLQEGAPYQDLKISFDNCINEFKKLDRIDWLLPSEQKELIGSINYSLSEFFRELAQSESHGNRSSKKLLQPLHSNFLWILGLRSEKLGLGVRAETVDKKVKIFYLDFASFIPRTPFSSELRSSNCQEVKDFTKEGSALISKLSKIGSKDDVDLRTEINELSLALTQRINSTLPNLTASERDQVDELIDKIHYEFKHKARLLGII